MFTPDDPCVYTLNASAWLIFELCDGRSWDQMQSDYCAAVSPLTPPAEARQQFEAGITRLEQQKLIRTTTTTLSAAQADGTLRTGDAPNG